MNNHHLQLFNQIEAERISLIKKLDAIDQHLLVWNPNINNWSILQICYHLIRSEELSLMYLNKKIFYKSHIRPAGLITMIRSWLLNLALRAPFRLKAPRRVAEFPDDLEWSGLKQKWTQIREGIKNILETLPEEYENMSLYKHPAVGRLTLYQMLTFFQIHIKRHEKQIRQLIHMGKINE